MKDDILSKHLCLALAFQTMIANGKLQEKGTAKRVIDLARATNEFMEMHFAEAFPSATKDGGR